MSVASVLRYSVSRVSRIRSAGHLQAGSWRLYKRFKQFAVIKWMYVLPWVVCRIFHTLSVKHSELSGPWALTSIPSHRTYLVAHLTGTTMVLFSAKSSGAIVLEREDFRRQSVPRNYGTVNGWGIAIDANRNPNSSIEGEVRAIKKAMSCSSLKPRDIHYINPHGTGSPVGDEIELRALREVGLNNAYINTTKSVIGHGLSSAGTAEVIATLLQMQQNEMHPCLNLQNPLYDDFNWVRSRADAVINQVLCLSYGFGGINTALCFKKS